MRNSSSHNQCILQTSNQSTLSLVAFPSSVFRVTDSSRDSTFYNKIRTLPLPLFSFHIRRAQKLARYFEHGFSERDGSRARRLDPDHGRRERRCCGRPAEGMLLLKIFVPLQPTALFVLTGCGSGAGRIVSVQRGRTKGPNFGCMLRLLHL